MGRKKPFSGKQKKAQLKERRKRKSEERAARRAKEEAEYTNKQHDNGRADDSLTASSAQVESNRHYLVSQFARESDEEVARGVADSERPLRAERKTAWARVVAKQSVNTPFVDIPKRPYPIAASERQLRREERMFRKWKTSIEQRYERERVNFFELNLEVWRQLWRCIEKSHMIALVVDARFPLFHFPHAVYRYVQSMKKPVILVLNKVDLVPIDVLDAWQAHFESRFADLTVVRYASFRVSDDPLGDERKRRLKKGKRHYDGRDGRTQFLKVVRELAPKAPEPVYEFADGAEHRSKEARNDKKSVYVGMIGHPNAGKSSLINGLVRRKVVSTSATPGHTKYFQTIQLRNAPDDAVDAEGIVLVDSPGLVFPAVDRPRSLQIICGLYPLALVRCFYPAIRVLGECVPLHRLYNLPTPARDDKDFDDVSAHADVALVEADDERNMRRGSSARSRDDNSADLASLSDTDSDSDIDFDDAAAAAADSKKSAADAANSNYAWSPYSICAALAKQRGFMMDRSGRPDVRRAALAILKDCHNGSITLYFRAPSAEMLSASQESRVLGDMSNAMEKLQLSDSDDSGSSGTSSDDEGVESDDAAAGRPSTPLQFRRQRGDTLGNPAPRASKPLRSGGSMLKSASAAQTSDDAEAALDSGGSSTYDGTRSIGQRQRAKRKGKKSKSMATFYGAKKQSALALEFSDDESLQVGLGDSSEEDDAGDSGAGSGSHVLSSAFQLRSKFRLCNNDDAGSYNPNNRSLGATEEDSAERASSTSTSRA